MRQLAIGDGYRILQLVGELTEAGPEHDRDVRRTTAGPGADGADRFIDVLEIGHRQILPPARRKLQEKPRDGRGDEIGQRAGEHGTQTEPRQIVAPRRRQRADAADLDAYRAEVGEAAERERRDGE